MDHMRGPITWGATLIGNGLMWAQSVNVGAIGAGITGLGFAAVGVYSYFQKQRITAYREMRQAEIDMQVESDRKLGPGLSRQMADIRRDLASALKDRDRAVAVAEQSQRDAKLARDEAHLLMLKLTESVGRIEDKQTSIEDKQTSIAAAVAHQPRVLVVDDDDATCGTLARFLGANGYEAICSGTLADATAKLSPDLRVIVLDLGLPDGSGIDLLRRVRADHMDVIVIVVTGTSDEETLLEADCAMSDFTTTKPPDHDELLAAIRHLTAHAPRPHIDDLDKATLAGSGPGVVPVNGEGQ